MTLDEAKTVAKLIGFADNGCSNCVHDLVNHANRLLPQFDWSAPYPDVNLQDTYNNRYDIECTDRYIQVTVEPIL